MADKPPPLATEEMRRLLRLNADRRYGINPPDGQDLSVINQVLPLSTNRVGSASWVQEGARPQLTLPQILQGPLLGVAGMADAPRTGEISPEMLRTLLMGIRRMGSFTPSGALASGTTQVPVEKLIRPAPPVPGLLSDRQREVPMKDRVY